MRFAWGSIFCFSVICFSNIMTQICSYSFARIDCQLLLRGTNSKQTFLLDKRILQKRVEYYLLYN